MLIILDSGLINKAVVFASYKIVESGAAYGFFDENRLNALYSAHLAQHV